MRRVEGKDVLERRLDSERRGVCDLVHDMNVAAPAPAGSSVSISTEPMILRLVESIYC